MYISGRELALFMYVAIMQPIARKGSGSYHKKYCRATLAGKRNTIH